MATIKITNDNFREEVLESATPCIVDFWATWCGPCRMMGPVLEEVANEHPEIKVCKINVDEEPGLASAFRVMSIPTLIAFRDGKAVNQSVGVISKDRVVSMLK
jgi:thioredoxin